MIYEKEKISQIINDRGLSLQSKALLIYLMQNIDAGNELVLFPDEIQEALHIGKSSYYTNLRKLSAKGYIKLEQSRDEKKRFSNTVCTFNDLEDIENGK